MFAVIRTGGKQYRVAPADLVEVEKLPGGAGDAVAFGDVLMVGDDAGVAVGSPAVAGATVAGEIIRQQRTAKILVFKKRRRQNSKRTHGHRQELTLVRITEILTDGKAPAARAEAPVKAEAASAEAAPAPKARQARAKAEQPAEATEGAAAKPARKPRAKTAKSADKE
jgi:large subunit ribosomal protein L21